MLKRRFIFTLVVAAILAFLAGPVGALPFSLEGDGSAAPSAPTQKKPKVYRGTEKGLTPPKVIFDPERPETKAINGTNPIGTVSVIVVVGIAGDVTDVKAVYGFDKELTAKAVNVVEAWKFTPAQKNGIAVPCQVLIKISFWRK
jgi:hypothetical protein